ncbi:hypothetical protein LTR57_009018 [Friedmanniomyces endolithicus]|nr:hypothetical protein LTR57_009018 [Friedmanniomyces endolithicus]
MSSGHSSNAENSDAATTKRTSKREHGRAEKLSHQAEIESRTNAGESCKQIADALQANGHQISDKTVARWRVQWGHRKRAPRTTKGQPLRAPRINTRRDVARDGSRRSEQDVTKERINIWAAEAPMMTLRRVWEQLRILCTLIQTPDPNRASMMGLTNMTQSSVANIMSQASAARRHMHRITGIDRRLHILALPTQQSAAVTTSADIMSAELLVDLVNSALVAATDLKDLVLAVQMRRPARNSLGALPPSAQDIMSAKKRVREAASMVVDLAMG